MLKIRLQRVGRHGNPQFRVIVADAVRGPKSGKFIEILGSYNPKMGTISLEGDRIKYWLSVGAKTSDTVHNFLVSNKIIDARKINALPKKTAIKKEEAKTENPNPPAGGENLNPKEETQTETPVVEETKQETPIVEEAQTTEETYVTEEVPTTEQPKE